MLFYKGFEDTSPFFHCRWEKDKKGKVRRLYQPNEAMELGHHRLIERLREQPNFPDWLSPNSFWNVHPHFDSHFFYCIDIKDAFATVNTYMLTRALGWLNSRWLSKHDELQVEFNNYCLAQEGGLATGANASPVLWDLVAACLIDRRLEPLCRKSHIVWTRFVDDLTFSSPYYFGQRPRRAIRDIIYEAGFSLNTKKGRFYDLAKGPIVITGIGLQRSYRPTKRHQNISLPYSNKRSFLEPSSETRVFLPRRELRRIKGLLLKALSGQEVNPNVINGLMSVFWSPWGGRLNDLSRLNSTERRVFELYQEYRLRKAEQAI